MSSKSTALNPLKNRINRILNPPLVEILQRLLTKGWIVNNNYDPTSDEIANSTNKEYLLILTEIGIVKRFDVPNTPNSIHYLSSRGHRMLINLPAKKASELTAKDYFKVVKKHLRLN